MVLKCVFLAGADSLTRSAPAFAVQISVDIFSFEIRIVGIAFYFKTGLPAHVLRAMIVCEDIRPEPRNVFIAANLNEALQQFRSQAPPLPLVTNDQGKFGLVQPAGLA